MKAQPDVTLAELCEIVEKETKIKSSPGMMQRELVQLKLQQKKSLHASQRDTPKVKEKCSQFRSEVSELYVKHFKFLDESGINIDLTRLTQANAEKSRPNRDNCIMTTGHPILYIEKQ